VSQPSRIPDYGDIVKSLGGGPLPGSPPTHAEVMLLFPPSRWNGCEDIFRRCPRTSSSRADPRVREEEFMCFGASVSQRDDGMARRISTDAALERSLNEKNPSWYTNSKAWS
jgi:hypothetical protein